MPHETPLPHQPPFDVPSVEEMAAYLPQYVFERLAAFGGMGAVFKARQESLDRPVAIKILPPEFGAEMEFAERFKSEARAMAKLSHTNIVAVYDFGITSGGHLYLVMEWVEGPTLHELIQKGSLPVRKAANLVMQLCEALSYAHGQRILHRDIKPGNIMVNQDDQVKVADFGLARPITGEAEENPYGTPDYAAPEILGKAAVDQRADIFAAGVVLYEMLTGRVPHRPRRSVTDYAPVSARWDELIDKATHPEPEKRFQDARDFRAHIAAVLSQATSAAAPAARSEPEALEKKAGFTPMQLLVGGVVALIVLASVLGVIFQGEPKPEETPEVAALTPPTPVPALEPEKPVEAPKLPKIPILPAPPVKITAPPNLEPVVEMPVVPKPGPEPKKVTLEPKRPVVVPAPVVVMKSAPVPVPEDPRVAILKLEERDPELAQLVTAFGDEWGANTAFEVESELKDLAGKYIAALQRGLASTPMDQRAPFLSEISHLANKLELEEPAANWPTALKTLRQTYQTQTQAILGRVEAEKDKMRAAQCRLVEKRARELAAAGKTEAAKLAEAVAAELARLKTAPSLSALKKSVYSR